MKIICLVLLVSILAVSYTHLAIVVVALFWGVALYNNARKGQTVVKELSLIHI